MWIDIRFDWKVVLVLVAAIALLWRRGYNA
jgi:hypothetical protein